MPYRITNETTRDKSHLLEYFRERGGEKLSELQRELGSENYKDIAGKINRALSDILQSFLEVVTNTAELEKWTSEDRLRSILTSTYCAQVAMIDLRNQVWLYEYMAFSRRVGELWERFVRIPFSYPVKTVKPFVPPLFSEVRSSLRKEIEEYIAVLALAPEQKAELLEYYKKVWILVDSGEINLQLDFHAEIDGKKVNIDFKSGFGSNEKGNTNRLLMVATIYRNIIEDDYENDLLVRAREDQNNHYFQILKDSKVWAAYCGEDAYRKISDYTGFDLRDWVSVNISWAEDLLPDTTNHFTINNLLGYLEW